MNTKRSEKLLGITLAAIMIASIFVAVVPSTVAEGPNPEAPPKTPESYPNSTIRIYGEEGFGPASIYYYWQDPFKPTEIPKDSITFNPAIQIDVSHQPDMDLKTHLRMWYEPKHTYAGLLPQYTRQNHTYPTIGVEYTYIFVDNKHKYLPGHAGYMDIFPFPIAEKDGQQGLGSTMNVRSPVTYEPDEVTVTLVGGTISEHNKTTFGRVQLEKLDVELTSGETFQFMDHALKFIGTSIDGQIAIVDIYYRGNAADDDTRKRATLDRNIYYYFDRHNVKYTSPEHPERTWKVQFRLKTQSHTGYFNVGKILQTGDTFYVDAVRYDIPAIEVVDTDGDLVGDEVKYITIRTPLPKCAETGISPVRDDSVVSSQWIDCIALREIIPLLPPFNAEHDMVDDIDIPLWAPTVNKDLWPNGDMDAPASQLGIAKFPCAERYVTQQYPPWQWLKYFRAIPIGGNVGIVKLRPGAEVGTMTVPCDWQNWENYGGPFYPGDDVPSSWIMATCGKVLEGPGVNYSVFDVNDWIAMDVAQRLVYDVNATEVYYVAEGKEERYSTDLLEKLNELYIGTPELYENWTKFDIQSLPDRYTEFVVPRVPDLNVTNCAGTQTGEYTQMLYGDYLITTSWWAPNALGDLQGWHEPYPRVAFSYDQQMGMDGIDIYVQDAENTGNNTVRVYSESGMVIAPPYGDNDWEAPFNPAWIRKDSITFDPAILQWDALLYPMSAQSTDADLKKYLRLWYEPCYPFQNGTSKTPAIVLESTYMLIEDKHKMPWHGSANDTFFAFPIAENESTDQIGLELFENVEGVPFERNMVALAGVWAVDDPIGYYNKTTNGCIRIEKTYELAEDETIQFLDHNLTFEECDTNGTVAQVRIWYAGNTWDENIGPDSLLKDVTVYFDRHNVPSPSGSAIHPKWTWYAKFNFKTQSHNAVITVGKELQRGDVFYVDGVRYEVAAIEVLDLNGDDYAEKFKYITIRTPYPKEVVTPPHSWADLTTDDTLMVRDDWGDGNTPANSIWIVRIPPCHPIPVNPPFNMAHDIVDDTDVQLWVPLKHFDKWPLGDPHGTKDLEYFPMAERYLTMQEPPATWLKFFRAVPVGVKGVPCDWQLWDNYGGPFYPTKMGKTAMEQWIANDVGQRIVRAGPLTFCWLYEQKEPRYSTNLLQILNENFDNDTGYLLNESWTKYDIQTLPDQFTEFRLPEIPDKVISHYPCDQNPPKQYDALKGSYLITTSFLAPNADGDLNLNQSFTDINRFAFIYDNNLSANLGLYMNEDPVYPEPEPVTQLALRAGWNLISLNVLPEDRSVEAIFGQGTTIYWYSPAGGWQIPSVVEAGKGYFVYSDEDTVVSIPTENSEQVELTWADLEPTLGAGWNLVGPGVMQIPAPATDYYLYKYLNNDYTIMYPADAMLPGQGYWVLKGPATP